MVSREMFAIVALCVSSLVLGQDSVEERVSPGGTSSCVLSRSGAPQNLPLLSNGTGKIYPRAGNNGDIIIANLARFNASCASSSVVLKEFQVNQLTLQCQDGNLVVLPDGTPTTYANLGCKEGLKEDVDEVSNGLCYGTAKNVSIEFNTATKKYPLITLCHDYDLYSTLYSKHTVNGASLKVAEVSNNRPSFKKAQFFSSFSVATAYSQANQKEMMKSLVGSSTRANEYIDSSQSFFFARGHLSPDGDFIYVSEQNATYYYINVYPQWQCINNGNWKAMEGTVRNLAQSAGQDLQVYTGGYGVLKLKHINNTLVEIYLGKDSTGKMLLPVPRLTWKIIHNPATKSAVAIIMVNNPHDLGITSEDIICSDKCDQLSYVTWDTKNIKKGYTYCCDVTSFRSVVKYAPNLGRVTLMK